MYTFEEMETDLRKMGLSEYESKAFLTLIGKGILSAPSISKHSGVPKSKIYGILEKLSEKRMIEEYPGKPKKFKARSPKFVFKELVEKEKKKVKSLQEVAEKLSKRMEDLIGSKEVSLAETDTALWTVNGRHAFHEKYAEMLGKAEKEVLVCSTSASRHPAMDRAILGASKRDVTMKGITSVTDNDVKQRVKYYSNFFNLKNYPDLIPLTIVIIDRKECMYRLQYDFNGKTNYVGVWSDNQALVDTFYHYWKSLWDNSKNINFD